MSTSERITSEVEKLDAEGKAEVLDFVEFLKAKRSERKFKEFSLEGAMRGMDDEPDLYQKEDIRDPI
jgi:hypothetical protein